MNRHPSSSRTLFVCCIFGCVSGGIIGIYQIAQSKFDSPSVVMAFASELAKVVGQLVSEQFEAALFFIIPIIIIIYVTFGAVAGLLFGFIWNRSRKSSSR